MYDPDEECLQDHTDAELSALYGTWERIWRGSLQDTAKTRAKAVLDKISQEQDRRHPGFYK